MSQSVGTMDRLETASSRKASDVVIAYTIMRLSFGANILLHGVSRLLNGLPAFAAVLPWVETTLGLLLVLGLFSRFTLIVGALVLTALVVGTNLAQDWLVAGLQLPYIFIYYYLLIHLEQNTVSLDNMLGMGGH